MKVYIDSACDIHYASYYIHGLYKSFGRSNVKFSSKDFRQFEHNNHFLAFILKDQDKQSKFIIDFTDSKIIDEKALAWSDIYGKINIDPEMKLSPKVISIGPSFGIQIYSLVETLWFAGINYIKSVGRIPNKRRFFADYKSQYKRPKLKDYAHQTIPENYIFFMASLWKKEPETNKFRANFIKSCQVIADLNFEGGFAPRTKNDIAGFESMTVNSRVDMATYMSKIKSSLLAFNTPAVKGCHGWKLAEYLCLGKAIISTSLIRKSPALLEDNKHILLTDGSVKDISAKIEYLIQNPEQRLKLEIGGHDYFQNQLHPIRVIEILLKAAKKRL